MATKITNEVELTFGFSSGSSKKATFGSYNSSDTSLTQLADNIKAWNDEYCPTDKIVDSDGSSCTGITAATIISTVTEDVPA